MVNLIGAVVGLFGAELGLDICFPVCLCVGGLVAIRGLIVEVLAWKSHGICVDVTMLGVHGNKSFQAHYRLIELPCRWCYCCNYKVDLFIYLFIFPVV